MIEKPFEGVHFYSAEELGAILAGFATQWSKKTGRFKFDDSRFAKDLAMISAANAKAYQIAHGIAKTPHTVEEIISALPSKPVPFLLGQLREFQRGLNFNLLGYEPAGPITNEDIETMGREANAATMFIWTAVRDQHTGPSELP